MIVIELKALISYSHHCYKHEAIELGYFALERETKMYYDNVTAVVTTTGVVSVTVNARIRMEGQVKLLEIHNISSIPNWAVGRYTLSVCMHISFFMFHALAVSSFHKINISPGRSRYGGLQNYIRTMYCTISATSENALYVRGRSLNKMTILSTPAAHHATGCAAL